MVFDVVTIFPEFFDSILVQGMLKRAVDGKYVDIRIHDLREYTDDRHRTVDDRPFGGGPGMVFKPEPVFRAVEAIRAEGAGRRVPVILMSPQGRLLTQRVAEELLKEPRLILVCGRYEGMDERVAEHLATDEISIGEYVLSGGELPAAVVIEAVSRLIPGVLGNSESLSAESYRDLQAVEGTGHAGGLDCPHYTRPPEFRGWGVPEVLLSGNHGQIRQWRHRKALEKTWNRRPDLLERMALSPSDRKVLQEIRREVTDSVTPDR
jgi:tRNA (guanine37-N1)-methyltransferase